jgi:hypothetical protein
LLPTRESLSKIKPSQRKEEGRGRDRERKGKRKKMRVKRGKEGKEGGGGERNYVEYFVLDMPKAGQLLNFSITLATKFLSSSFP